MNELKLFFRETEILAPAKSQNRTPEFPWIQAFYINI